MQKNIKKFKKLPAIQPRLASPARRASYFLQARRGFTLIEILITLGIFVIITAGIYFTYANIIEVIANTRLRTLATSILNQQLEFVRNLPYENVGLVSGVPAGLIAPSSTINFEGQQFIVSAYVRNIDDPFDGTATSTPRDTAIGDYKLVELRVDCPTCFRFTPVSATTWSSPKQLEGSSKNGALFVDVFDANNDPISGATVNIYNNTGTSTINITDVTNVSGMYELVDTPTSTNGYQVTVSKPGFSSARTYAITSQNPNPDPAHATVATGQVTEIGFSIDQLSGLNLKTQDFLCSGIGSVPLTLTGDKLIGIEPDVAKTSFSTSTNSSGLLSILNLEWDNYTAVNGSNTYDIAGVIPENPFSVDPGATSSVQFVLEPQTSTSLLITVVDSNGDMLPEATVNIVKGSTNLTLVAGERSLTDTNWAGNFTAQSGFVDTANPAGQIAMKKTSGNYPTTTEWLISSTFNLGTSTTAYHNFSWNPLIQPAQSGVGSVQFQVAAANLPAGPFIFVGPNGTPGTFYTAPGALPTTLNGMRYFQYKVYFSTANTNFTPVITDVTFSFASGCIPSSQVFFSGLSTGTYNVTVSKTGYQNATSSISVGSGWQEDEETLY
jgi:prepilin-type N-terminal cleavage/methylation domain-containing protein